MSDNTLALNGFDPVAYFTQDKAVKGSSAFQANQGGNTWYFSSQENLDSFNRDPKQYAPQHDGLCAFASSLNVANPPAGNPTLFTVSNGKLYLSANRVAALLWKRFAAPKGKLVQWAKTLLVVLLVSLAALLAFAKTDLPQGEQLGAQLTENWYGPVATNDQGIAIEGYDTVAYFELGQATQGSADYAFDWNGATWHFSSQQHLDLFRQNPSHYAPQLGGHCSFGASTGQKVVASPEQWSIVDGRLFMNLNPVAKALFRILPQRAAAAYAQWDSVK